MSSIIIIEHGGQLKEFIFQRLQKLKHKFYLVTYQPEKWLLKYFRKNDMLITDTFDLINTTSNVLKWILDNKIKIDAVGTFKESSVIQTADICESLGCIGLTSLAARRSSQNKFVMRYILKKNGFKNQPNFDLIDVNKTIDYKLNYAAVLKPLFGSASRGVIKVNKGEDLSQKIKSALTTLSATELRLFKSFKGIFLLEEYIDGGVFSVDGIIQGNKIYFAGVTEFIMGPEPFFTQIGVIIPAKITSTQEKLLYRNTEIIINILQFNNCGFHAEFRVNGNKISLIEIAARLPGGGIPLCYEKAWGLKLTESMIDVWLGNKISFRREFLSHVMRKAVYPYVTENSTLENISNIEDLKKINGVWDTFQFSSNGDILYAYPRTPTRLYYYALQSNNRTKLMQLSKKVESSVIFKYKRVLSI